MDDHAVRSQNAPLLTGDLRLDALVVALAWIRRPEFRRSEQPTVLHAVERGTGKKVERARTAKVDLVVLEPLAGKIARVERDRFRPELDQQAREPRLEQGGALARRR